MLQILYKSNSFFRVRGDPPSKHTKQLKPMIIIVHYIILYASHSFVVYITNIPHLKVLNVTTITVNYNGFARVGSVEVKFVEHVFDSKELQLRHAPPHMSMFQLGRGCL